MRFARVLERSLRGRRQYSSAQSYANRFFKITDRKYNLVMLLLVGAVSSELMWIIRTRNETERVTRESTTEVKIMDRVIARVKAGEKVDVEKELLERPAAEDVSVDAILSQIEEMDAAWKKAATKLPTAPKEAQDSGKGASSSSFL